MSASVAEAVEDYITPCYKPDVIEGVRAFLPPDYHIRETASLHAALADPTRLKILLALSRVELCVCDVSHVLGLSLSATSHQLRVLRNLNLVSYRSDGRMAYYSLREPNPIRDWIEQAIGTTK